MDTQNSLLADILIFISALGFVQGFIFSMIIPMKDRKGSWQCNNFLGMYILSLSLLMLMPIFEKYVGWQYTWWIYPMLFVMNPSLLCYVESFTQPITWKEIGLHFIAAIFFAVFGYFYTQYNVERIGNQDIYLALLDYTVYDYFFLFSIIIHWSIYFILSYRAVNQHHKFVQENFSEISKIDLVWAKQLIWGNLLILLVTIVLQILQFQVSNGYENYILNTLNIAFVTPYIYFTFLKGIRQPSIFHESNLTLLPSQSLQAPLNQIIENDIAKTQEKPKYEKTKITDERVKDILNQVVSAMETDKKFLDPELSLQSLSEDLKIPSYQISQVLNQHLEKNFYDFVNHYRVEEVKKELQNRKKQHLSILAIALDSGFNSKSTFNTVFKQHTSFTPSAYRKQQS